MKDASSTVQAMPSYKLNITGKSQSSQIPKVPNKLGANDSKMKSMNMQSKEDMIDRLRMLVADKNSTGSVMLANSRLFQDVDNNKFTEKFEKRSKEVLIL
jgi:hypothetical protein